MLSLRNRAKSSLFSVVSVAVAGTSLMAVAPSALAAGTTMYLSPATKSVTSGQSLTETIYIDTGAQEADTVNVVVDYDASKLQYVSYSTGSSQFGLFPGTASQTSGEVKWVGTDLGGSTTGVQLVGTVTFKALASSGSSDLTMPGGNIARAGTALNPTLTGATISFAPAPADTTKPSVSLTSPTNNATVSGNVTLKATASDNKAVTKVEFFVDGKLKSTDTTSTYSYSFDTTSVSNGSHTFKAVAYDAAGNTNSSSVTANVSNTSGGGSTSSDPSDGGGNVTTPKAPDTGFGFSGSNMYIASAVGLLALAGIAVGLGRYGQKLGLRR